MFRDIKVADGISRKSGADIDAANDYTLGASSRALQNRSRRMEWWSLNFGS